MLRRTLAAFAAVCLSGCAAEANLRDSGARAIAVLEASRAATGGAGWDQMDGVYERGEHGGVAYATWLDFHAYGMRSDSERDGGPATLAYNGEVAWHSRGGQAAIVTDAAALAERRQSAYVSMNGYYFPERFPARFSYRGRERIQDVSYDIVRAEPAGALGVDLWFDARTHLLARIVDYASAHPVTVTLSDYRDVGPIQFAFHGVITDPQGAVIEAADVQSMEPWAVDRTVFDPPGR